MAWYLNHYHCTDCGTSWADEWSCCCDDECPSCGSRNWSPHESDNLTEVIVEKEGSFTVCRSPDSAGHYPDYVPIAQFATHHAATRFVNDGELT